MPDDGPRSSLPLLDASNFSRYVPSAAVALVLFTLPGCPHEPSGLRPALAAANDLQLSIAHATPASSGPGAYVCEDAQLAARAGVDSFPSLRLYRAGVTVEAAEPYLGPLHSPVALASRLRREMPHASPLQASSAKDIRDEIDAVQQVALLFAPSDSPVAAMVRALAAGDPALRRRVSFVIAPPHLRQHFELAVPDAAAAAESEATAASPLLLLYRHFDEDVLQYPHGLWASEAAGEDLRDWLGMYKRPAFSQITPHNFDDYEGIDQPLFWLFVNNSCCSAENDALRTQLRMEAMRRRGRAVFVWIDGERYAHHAASLAVAPGVLPVLAAESAGSHFVYSGSLQGNPAAVAHWLDLVVEGTLRPTLRSAPPPLYNPGPLYTVVAATFGTLVASADVDVLLLITAPWCTACEALGAVVQAVATRWEGERLVRIGTFDAGSNDLPRSLQVATLPALLFFRRASGAGDGGGDANGGGGGGNADGGGGGETDGDALPPVDLSHLTSADQITDEIVRHASAPMRKPVDLDRLHEALESIPRFQHDAQQVGGRKTAGRTPLCADCPAPLSSPCATALRRTYEYSPSSL